MPGNDVKHRPSYGDGTLFQVFVSAFNHLYICKHYCPSKLTSCIAANGGVDEGINGGVRIGDNQEDIIYTLIREGVNEGINEGLIDFVNILLNVSGLNAVELASRMDKSLSTIERYLRMLRKRGIIEYRGSKKTGGYHLTDAAKKKVQ